MTIRVTRLFGLIVGALAVVATLPAVGDMPSAKVDALLSGLIQTNDPGLAVLANARPGRPDANPHDLAHLLVDIYVPTSSRPPPK